MAKTSDQLDAEAIALAGETLPVNNVETNTPLPPPPPPLMSKYEVGLVSISEAEHEEYLKLKSAQTQISSIPKVADPVKQSREQYLLQEYGPGYVTATKGSEERIFKALAWNNLGFDNEYNREGKAVQLSTKAGWTQKAPTPPEIAGMGHNFSNQS